MAKFTDCLGREWALKLTVADLKPLREDLQFDPYTLADSNGLAEVILTNPEKLVAVLHLLAKPKDVTPDGFAEGFDGEALERGGNAFLEAIADFFPRSRVSTWMKTTIRERMSHLEDTLIRFLQSSGSATNSPAPSAASTPAP